MSVTKNEFILIPLQEYTLRDKEVHFSETDLQILLEYQDVFDRFIEKGINRIQSWLWLLQYVQNEQSAYIGIKTLKELQESVRNSWDTYRDFKEERQAKKEARKKK